MPLLLAFGADASAKNTAGDTALDLGRDPTATNALIDAVSAKKSVAPSSKESVQAAFTLTPVGAEIKAPLKKAKMKVTLKSVVPK